MKRPWTPGPWAAFHFDNRPDYPRKQADNLIASKAPEMVELLIEFCDEIDIRNDYSTFVKLAYRAKDLIKEIGHETTTEASPKE